MNKITAILALAGILLTLTACKATKGSIIIKENLSSTGCEMEFSEWSEENTYKLELNKKDELLIDIVCDSGSVALDISGKDGAEAYTGSGLKTGLFTVRVPEADVYVITVRGDVASGSIAVRRLSEQS
jgi:hypothetical protein